jgi:hypothetical protein
MVLSSTRIESSLCARPRVGYGMTRPRRRFVAPRALGARAARPPNAGITAGRPRPATHLVHTPEDARSAPHISAPSRSRGSRLLESRVASRTSARSGASGPAVGALLDYPTPLTRVWTTRPVVRVDLPHPIGGGDRYAGLVLAAVSSFYEPFALTSRTGRLSARPGVRRVRFRPAEGGGGLSSPPPRFFDSSSNSGTAASCWSIHG